MVFFMKETEHVALCIVNLSAPGFAIFAMVTLGTFQGMGTMITINGGGFRA